MSIFDFFRSDKQGSANVARDRLQVIVAHERSRRNQPDYLPRMRQEIIDVIRKYVAVDQDKVEVQVDRIGSCSVLELNVVIPGIAQ